MEKIPPKERYSQNEKSIVISPEVLRNSLELFGMNPHTSELRKLSGGFMNTNFLASGEDRVVVLRVYSTDMYTAKKEFDILRFLENHPVSAPKALAIFEVSNRPVVVLEYLEGITLEDKLLSGDHFHLDIYEQIGRELGQIHNIRFEDAGFIGPEMKIGKEYESFSTFIRQYIEQTLRTLESRHDRLDIEVNRRLLRLVQDRWNLNFNDDLNRQLVHCDFNPKNIIVSQDKKHSVGIIDWEFSNSGNGLIDLGNFFRFSYDYPADARARFIAGYRAVNSNLPAEWEDSARLLDLGNMCSFLERREDYQKSFRTARAVIMSTLEHFGY